MNDARAFSVEWNIPEEQWEKARMAVAAHTVGTDYDRRGLGRYYLLYGDVDFNYDDDRFYGKTYGINGINISLFDFGLALADAYLKQSFAPGERTIYDQLDDNLQIRFSGELDVVRVTASDRARDLVVPREAFLEGVRKFLCGLAGALDEHVTGLLDWESMRSLKEVKARCCYN